MIAFLVYMYIFTFLNLLMEEYLKQEFADWVSQFTYEDHCNTNKFFPHWALQSK